MYTEIIEQSVLWQFLSYSADDRRINTLPVLCLHAGPESDGKPVWLLMQQPADGGPGGTEHGHVGGKGYRLVVAGNQGIHILHHLSGQWRITGSLVVPTQRQHRRWVVTVHQFHKPS